MIKARHPYRRTRAKQTKLFSDESLLDPSEMPSKNKIEVSINWHPDQAKVFDSRSRFKVVFCGRRWGKTRGAVTWLVVRLFERKKKLGWWVSPTYRQAKIAWRYFFMLFRKSGLIASFNKSELTIQLIQGRRIEFRSADTPENLRGEGVDELVLDEFADQPQAVWIEVLRPALMDSKGEAVFIGTPNGMNWATDLFNVAKSADGKEWSAWQFSTYSNPYIDHDEIKAVEAGTPQSVVRQEIYAEPTQNASAVFRNIDEISVLQPQPPTPGVRYTMGVDLAKYKDFTVIAVFSGMDQVYLERFNQIDWSLQERRIVECAKRFNNANVIVDSTGLGDVIFERLKKAGLRVSPYQLNQSSKKELIDTLSVRCDQKEVHLLDDAVQRAELNGYAYELTHGGRLRTNAPSGMHDDTVIAVALATYGNVPGTMAIQDFYRDQTEQMLASLPPEERESVRRTIATRQKQIDVIFHGAKR